SGPSRRGTPRPRRHRGHSSRWPLGRGTCGSGAARATPRAGPGVGLPACPSGCGRGVRAGPGRPGRAPSGSGPRVRRGGPGRCRTRQASTAPPEWCWVALTESGRGGCCRPDEARTPETGRASPRGSVGVGGCGRLGVDEVPLIVDRVALGGEVLLVASVVVPAEQHLDVHGLALGGDGDGDERLGAAAVAPVPGPVELAGGGLLD